MIERRWRAVPGWEGHYEVSEDGAVRSLDRYLPWRGPGPHRFHPGRLLAPKREVRLRDGQRQQVLSRSILVAATWRGFPMPEAQDQG